MTKIAVRVYVPMEDDLERTKNKIKQICRDELDKLNKLGCQYEFSISEQFRDNKKILRWVNIELGTFSDCPLNNWECYWILNDLVEKANKYIINNKPVCCKYCKKSCN